MNAKSLQSLKQVSKSMRNLVVEMCVKSGGHIASSLSCVEILVALYHGGELNVDPSQPDRLDRDRFILSKGHGETILFAVLADFGFFPRSYLFERYRQGDCYLGGHPDHKIPGVEISSGSLGHGLGVAAGLAFAAKYDNLTRRHYVLMGDAECTEGSVWEAAMFASRHGLNNLVAIVDRNKIGSLDFTDSYTGLEPFKEKWVAFGWSVLTVDGHDIDKLDSALKKARNSEFPTVIVANTVKGKGISFVENDPSWHVRCLSTPDEISCAKRELE